MSLLKVMFVFSFFIFFIPVSAQANMEACPAHALKIEMKSKITKTKVFRGTSKSLTEWQTGHSDGTGRILGLAGGDIGTDFKGEFNIIDAGEKKFCVNMTGVKGIFYAYPEMYLASEYKKGSCEYQQILKHETRHINALRNFHSQYTDAYKSYLGRIALTLPVPKPVEEKDVETVKEQLMTYFFEKFSMLELQSRLELRAAQAKIDSPEEYRGVAMRCQNW